MKKLFKFNSAFFILLLVSGSQSLHATSATLSVEGYHPVRVELVPISSQPPQPAPPQPAPSTPPNPPRTSDCQNGVVQPGVLKENMFLNAGQTHSYCIFLPMAAKVLSIQEYDQCLGTNLSVTLIPPSGATYSNSVPIPVTTARSSIILGNSRQSIYIPAGTYIIQIVGREPGPNCSGHANKYDLGWSYSN